MAMHSYNPETCSLTLLACALPFSNVLQNLSPENLMPSHNVGLGHAFGIGPCPALAALLNGFSDLTATWFPGGFRCMIPLPGCPQNRGKPICQEVQDSVSWFTLPTAVTHANAANAVSFDKYSFGYRYAFHKVRSSSLTGLPVSRSLF